MLVHLRFKTVREITPRFVKTAFGDIRIKPVVTMDIDERERDEKTARLRELREELQNKYAVLDVIDETVSVPQQRRQMEEGTSNDETRSLETSRLDCQDRDDLAINQQQERKRQLPERLTEESNCLRTYDFLV